MATKTKTCDIYILNEDNSVRVQKNVSKPDLSAMQKIVGGLIEFVYHADLAKKQGVDVIANEEGLCIGMDLNRSALRLLGIELVGPVGVIDKRSDRTISPFKKPPVTF